MLNKILKIIFISFGIFWFSVLISIDTVITFYNKMHYYVGNYQLKRVDFINLNSIFYQENDPDQIALTNDSDLIKIPIHIKSNAFKIEIDTTKNQLENPKNGFQIIYNLEKQDAIYVGKIHNNIFLEIVDATKEHFLFLPFLISFIVLVFNMIYFLVKGYQIHGNLLLYAQEMGIYLALLAFVNFLGLMAPIFWLIQIANLRDDLHLNYDKYVAQTIEIDSFNVYGVTHTEIDYTTHKNGKRTYYTESSPTYVYLGYSGKCYSKQLGDGKIEILVNNNKLIIEENGVFLKQKMKVWFREDIKKAILANNYKPLNSYWQALWKTGPKFLSLCFFYEIFSVYLFFKRRKWKKKLLAEKPISE